MLNERDKSKKIFVYFKNVSSTKLDDILNRLFESFKEELNGHTCMVFQYGLYTEEEYRTYVSQCKFGIWVGSHESQGFALQEALSCNCPLFVYDVNLLDECTTLANGIEKFLWWENCEKNGIDPKIMEEIGATSAPYFDDRCGVIFKTDKKLGEEANYNNMVWSFSRFLRNVGTYEPRKYVLEELSVDKFYRRICGIMNRENLPFRTQEPIINDFIYKINKNDKRYLTPEITALNLNIFLLKIQD